MVENFKWDSVLKGCNGGILLLVLLEFYIFPLSSILSSSAFWKLFLSSGENMCSTFLLGSIRKSQLQSLDNHSHSFGLVDPASLLMRDSVILMWLPFLFIEATSIASHSIHNLSISLLCSWFRLMCSFLFHLLSSFCVFMSIASICIVNFVTQAHWQNCILVVCIADCGCTMTGKFLLMVTTEKVLPINLPEDGNRSSIWKMFFWEH